MEKKNKHKTAGHAFQVNATEMKTNNKYTHPHKNSQYQNSKVTKRLTVTKNKYNKHKRGCYTMQKLLKIVAPSQIIICYK